MWRPGAPAPEGFEDFYQDARDRLLLQCFALCGDLEASQRAVRDAAVVARHHWRKVARLERAEDWVRPLAWTRARRRARARSWLTQPGLDAEARATLDALARLSTGQRTVLLLTLLTPGTLDAIAREAGVSRTVAERDLQAATAQFSVHREVASTSVRTHVEALGGSLRGVRWPRPSTVCREGDLRRRTHTVAGAAVVVAALVVSGALVTDAGGARPALATQRLTDGDGGDGRDSAADRTPAASAEPDPLTTTAMLSPSQLTMAVPGQWTQGTTSRNTAGDGLVFTCQAGRYADPRGVGALVRTFTGTGPRGGALTAGQSAEASADESAAQQAYTTALDWYAGCASPRVQLVGTAAVSGVGDQAALLVLRDWNDPQLTQVVGVARTGRLVTTVVSTQPDGAGTPTAVDLSARARLLGTAVTGLCTLPDHGACTTTPSAQDAPPFPVGVQPGLLDTVDLPPVTGVAAAWAASDPGPATQNAAATRCDDADFSTGFDAAVTRTYVIPSAPGLSTEFGLAETAGVRSPAQARAFVAALRTRLAGCDDRDLGTKVTQVTRRSSQDADLIVWRLDVDVSKKRSVRFLMAVVRDQGTVAQLTFVPTGRATMSEDTFVDLAERAQQRLAYLTSG